MDEEGRPRTGQQGNVVDPLEAFGRVGRCAGLSLDDQRLPPIAEGEAGAGRVDRPPLLLFLVEPTRGRDDLEWPQALGADRTAYPQHPESKNSPGRAEP